ncbi:uncharacterized protein METZ01_LOCUS261923, partial [marine metagenome]
VKIREIRVSFQKTNGELNRPHSGHRERST